MANVQSHEPSFEKQEGNRIARTWRALRVVARHPAGFASLIALLIGVVMSAAPAFDVRSIGVASIGYALVGAAFFSLIYQFWADDALVKVISSKMDKAQRDTYHKITTQWKDLTEETTSRAQKYLDNFITMHKRHWPLKVFPEGNSPNPEFNAQMERDLKRAVRYDFRGQSGKHTTSRLVKTFYPKLKIIRIIVEDVTISQVMNGRIDERRFGQAEDVEDLSDSELRRVILNDMLDSLIGLYLIRSRFDSLEIAYATRPTDVRIEITDGIVYSSPFIRNRPAGFKYPEVFCYDRDSVPAEVASLEFDREFGLLSGSKVRLDSSTSDEKFRAHLRSKGWDLSQEEFGERCRQAQRSLRAVGDALAQ